MLLIRYLHKAVVSVQIFWFALSMLWTWKVHRTCAQKLVSMQKLYRYVGRVDFDASERCSTVFFVHFTIGTLQIHLTQPWFQVRFLIYSFPEENVVEKTCSGFVTFAMKKFGMILMEKNYVACHVKNLAKLSLPILIVNHYVMNLWNMTWTVWRKS